ncbi:MAG: helix-turn-helix domain-containing protein [Enterococcus sp.]|uniref:helix-turn-helix domain-containing protein n=1 Tax=Enterococcus sp. TaxID=35783 RepID=UPI0026470123|nr:helix-turn-helix domain-containing protein [Enterococcus sp.]MDN6002595.1 helix-turn-helix domain-containing protein [Enterococcus sp.]MDN6559979.1 helix-turn-helix domain-containing protein [Enterococcus sp.]MDN6776668.1 helix-turn-helix domain-containing protein [Enterococcus sp.]
MVNHRGYYAIIPAEIRYDDSLIPSAKLLYGEITALCNDKGYCWASNDYFARQYGVSKPTIQNWLKSLESRGYIYRQVKHKEGSKEIEARYIRILGGGHQENLVGGHQEIYQDNNTSINNTFNNTKEYIGDLPPSKTKAKPTRHKYGEYKNVLLSDEQLEKLKKEFPADWEARIERVSSYCESTGKSYKNYFATIKNWAKKDHTGNRYGNKRVEKLPSHITETPKKVEPEIDWVAEAERSLAERGENNE